MILEDIEQHTLSYLTQVTNPLVRIATLYENVKSKFDTDIISLKDFTDFLKEHDQFKVLNPLAMTENEAMAKSLEAAGLSTSLCAILHSRIPSSQDLAAAMIEQLTSMTHALTAALSDARATGDTVKGHQIYETLERVQALEKKIIQLTKST